VVKSQRPEPTVLFGPHTLLSFSQKTWLRILGHFSEMKSGFCCLDEVMVLIEACMEVSWDLYEIPDNALCMRLVEDERLQVKNIVFQLTEEINNVQ